MRNNKIKSMAVTMGWEIYTLNERKFVKEVKKLAWTWSRSLIMRQVNMDIEVPCDGDFVLEVARSSSNVENSDRKTEVVLLGGR